MENAIQFNPAPTVFNPGFVVRLAESNRALRQLRALGCRVLSLQLAETSAERTEIVVDRNPHEVLRLCPSVHVTFQAGR